MTKTALASLSLLLLGACTNVVETNDGFDDGAQISRVDVGEDGPASATEDGSNDDGTTAEALTAGTTCNSNAHTGDYCGGDKVSHGNAGTLYTCHGPGPVSSAHACAHGCQVAPAGHDDYCKAAPPPTCTSTAHTGDYCGGDKVANASSHVLYHCDGPGAAAVAEACASSCTVAPAGHDDYCAAGSCAHHSQLKWGLAPAQSDHLRCAGIDAGDIVQTIGNAAASAGTHAQDGTIDGFAYSAATDLSVSGLSSSEVKALLTRLADQGFAAFYRNPGHDGWPSSDARHIHAIYVGVHMKSSLRAQVADWIAGKNGLVSHTTYTFWQANHSEKQNIQALFNAHN